MARKKKRPQSTAAVQSFSSPAPQPPEHAVPPSPPPGSESRSPSPAASVDRPGPTSMPSHADSPGVVGSQLRSAPNTPTGERTRDPLEAAIENEVLSRLKEAESRFWEGVRVATPSLPAPLPPTFQPTQLKPDPYDLPLPHLPTAAAPPSSTTTDKDSGGNSSKRVPSPSKRSGRGTAASAKSLSRAATRAGSQPSQTFSNTSPSLPTPTPRLVPAVSHPPPTPPPPPPVSTIPPPSRSPFGPLSRLRTHLDRAIQGRNPTELAASDASDAARAARMCALGLASLGYTGGPPTALIHCISSLRASYSFSNAVQLLAQARAGSQSAGCLSLIMQACGVPGMGPESREEARRTLEQVAGTWPVPQEEELAPEARQGRRRGSSPGRSTTLEERMWIWNLLGVWCTEGFAGDVDLGKAFGWLHRAARAGCVHAMYPLARMYALGQGVLADPLLSIRWHARYVRRFWPDLASRIVADPPRGWIEAAKAATRGASDDVDALEAVPVEDFAKLAVSHYVVGRAGEVGGFETEGVARDATESVENYSRAVAVAADGASRISASSSVAEESPKSPDVPQPGYAHFPSMLRLALGSLSPAHLQHEYLPRAVLETAATHLMCATPRSAFELFVWHTERGDTVEAARHLSRACNAGHVPALVVLARCHIEAALDEGDSTRRAALAAEAAKLYRCAAAAGHAEAARGLAGMERSGDADVNGRPDEAAAERWRKATRVAASTGVGHHAVQGLGAEIAGYSKESSQEPGEARTQESMTWFSKALHVKILTDVGGVRYCATGREEVNWDSGARFERGGHEAIVRLGGGSPPVQLNVGQTSQSRSAIAGSSAVVAPMAPPPPGTDPTDILRVAVDLMTTPERPDSINELVDSLLRGAVEEPSADSSNKSPNGTSRMSKEREASARASFQSGYWAEKFRSVAPTLSDLVEFIDDASFGPRGPKPGGMVNGNLPHSGAAVVNGSEVQRPKRAASRMLLHLRDLKLTLHDAEAVIRSGGDRYLDALRLFSEVLLSPFFWIFDFQNPVLRLLCALCARYDMALNPTDPYGIAVEVVVAIRDRSPEVSLALLQQCIDIYRADGRDDLGEQCKVVFFWPRVWLLMRLDRWEEAVTQLTGMMVWIEQNMQDAPDKTGKLFDTYTLEYLEAQYWRAVCILNIHERKVSMTKSAVMEGQAPPSKDESKIVGSMFTRAMAIEDLKNYLSQSEGDACHNVDAHLLLAREMFLVNDAAACRDHFSEALRAEARRYHFYPAIANPQLKVILNIEMRYCKHASSLRSLPWMYVPDSILKAIEGEESKGSWGKGLCSGCGARGKVWACEGCLRRVPGNADAGKLQEKTKKGKKSSTGSTPKVGIRRYCSVACQLAHWRIQHSEECKPV
ncbi:hypothetical protein M427DRAFT_71618 [Gonapodya prolifera JEL478]|uniref:Uncharacterized protein n=1 Tax=Gonapodya prolifera (strain JEL478) TaxID=1344416 RepID=A0A139A8H2_GONPJ|nr:hypothetical protein M427DRAFT_71618 [Gonapodya prolifera JEL478]|eukprot:KXS13027.1 hypothetical protein M427DRAFT_71618 [Gonapodya prolifera JEL478]